MLKEKKKAVIVFDMPENCWDCPCFSSTSGEMYCAAARHGFTRSMEVMLKKYVPFLPGFCPVREMPEYKMDWRAGDGGYESGWNDCLDKIGGCRR